MEGQERQRGHSGAALSAGEDADALGDVLAAQGAGAQPLTAALAAADVATGQENHLRLRERQTGDTGSAAVPEHRAQRGEELGSTRGVSGRGAEPWTPICVPLSSPGCAGLGCAGQERHGTQGRDTGKDTGDLNGAAP